MNKVLEKGRILPHSIEAEQSVLGCVLISEDARFNILSVLKSDDFYVEAHKIIYSAMFDIHKLNKPVDFITITSKLENDNLVDSVGGVEYITTLTNIVPSAANYSHYVDIVKEDSILRKLVKVGNEIISNSFEGATKDQAIAFAEKSIFDISQNEDRSDLVHMKETMGEVMDKFQAIQQNPELSMGIPTGLYSLDKILNGLHKSDLILIAARPACGKSSLAMNIITNAAINAKAKCAVFSLEMPKNQLAQRCLCSVAYVSHEKAKRGELSVDEWKALWAANDKITKADIFVDDNSLNTPMDILSKCRRLKAERGLDLVMVDYLQLMSAGGKNKESRQVEISEISRSLKIIAKELNVPVIVLSQLSRAVETRKEHRPILSDLRESGAIEQDADIVMFIYRPDLYNDIPESEKEGNMAELIVAKHRNGEIGTAKVKFLKEITTFKDFDKNSNLQSLAKNAPSVKEKNESENLPEIMPIEDSNITDIF